MTKPVALVGDSHSCPKVEPGPVPHIGGPIIDAGQGFVTYNGLPVAVEGGVCQCTGVPTTDGHARGSSLVRIDGKGVMRIGDSTDHGGVITSGAGAFKSD